MTNIYCPLLFLCFSLGIQLKSLLRNPGLKLLAEVALSKQQRRLTNGFLKQMMHSMFTIFAIKFLLEEESMDELSSLSRQWKGVKISQTILSNF